MNEYEYVLVDRRGPITLVTLNRPEVMNALHYPAHCELDSVFDNFAADPAQWVAVVTGAGDRAFCAGNDLKYQAGGGAMESGPSGFGGLTSRFDLNKPVIAAVNGVAMGGGFEIALACDIIIAANTAIFALPEPRVGLAALAGGLHRLPRAIGMNRAMDMILTSRRVDAQEAHGIGLLADVVAPDALLDTALAIAATIAQASPMAIRAAKQAVHRGYDSDLPDALTEQWHYPAMQAMLASADFIEGPLAFAEKRQPQWAGR